MKSIWNFLGKLIKKEKREMKLFFEFIRNCTKAFCNVMLKKNYLLFIMVHINFYFIYLFTYLLI